MAKLTMIEEYAFSAAHYLPDFPEGDRDRQVHGHTWTVEIHVEVVTGERGYAFDHALLDVVADGVLAKVDHKLINEIPGLERGLNEDLARYLGLRFISRLFEHCGEAARLERLVLGQFSGGRGRRLVRHKTVWEPASED